MIGGADGSTEAIVLPLERALAMADEHGLDLVEVSPNQNPPVCKLLDYGRFKFVQAKKAKEARRSQTRSEQREVQLTPRIGEHDIESKIRTVRDLLTGGAKVKVSVKFRGREITHPDLAVKVLRRVAEAVASQAKLERAPTMEAKALSIILAPAGSQAVAAVVGGKGADAQDQNA
ncbi:MAG: translation initiation factor IF-3 [Chloroflexi bacterium]|nr:translation initiation factor IF-3 [Chloroflexota bacterium]